MYAWLEPFRCDGDRMCVIVSIFVITISSERGNSLNETVAWISWNWWMNVCGKHFGSLYRMHCIRFGFLFFVLCCVGSAQLGTNRKVIVSNWFFFGDLRRYQNDWRNQINPKNIELHAKRRQSVYLPPERWLTTFDPNRSAAFWGKCNIYDNRIIWLNRIISSNENSL